mgnify:CR=1 FL=1
MTKNTELDAELASLKADAEAADKGLPLPSLATTQLPAGEAGKSVEGDAPPQPTADAATEPAREPETKETEQAGGKTAPETPPDKAAPETTPAPKSRLEKKSEALERTWENANKRHQEAEARENALTRRERELVQKETQLEQLSKQVVTPDDPLPKHTFDDLAKSLSDFVEEGDVRMAKQLAASMATKAKAQLQATGPDNARFRSEWDNARQLAVQSHPELNDPKSPLYSNATQLLTGKWASFFSAHPAGPLAAAEVAKLQVQLGQMSALQDEVATLRKKLQLDGAAPASRLAPAGKRWETMTVDEQLAQLKREAEALP